MRSYKLLVLPILFFTSTLFSYGLGVQTREFYDETRKRPVIVEIWYPVEDNARSDDHSDEEDIKRSIWVYEKEERNIPICSEYESYPSFLPLFSSQKKYPLIMFSHGSGGERRDRIWYASALAKRGYIVASVDHFANTFDNLSIDAFLTVWDRPLDISFALTNVLEDSEFKDAIDQNRIGFHGYSFGGMTGLWLAGSSICPNILELAKDWEFNDLDNESIQAFIEIIDLEKLCSKYSDSRIKSYFLFSPMTMGFSNEALSQVQAPMHVVYTVEDRIVDPLDNTLRLAEAAPHIELSPINGKANHFVFLNEVSEIGKQKLPKWVFEEDPSVDRKEIHDAIVELTDDFFKRTL